MKKILPLLLPAVLLALASCSTEPSDWRPDKKVSVDLVPPGTRETDNFNPNNAESLGHEKATSPTRGDAVRPSDVMSGDTQKGTAEPSDELDNALSKMDKSSPAPDTARGQTNAPK